MTTKIKQLMEEFGYLFEDADESAAIEQDVKDQLTRAAVKDEVDTVAFGLETDDGQIVKVYVNAEHAEKFEQEMAEMLGEVDDIEQALNEISKDIDIIDVEWPNDADDESEEDLDDAETAGETDGGEALDSKVYSKENKAKEGVKERLSYGDELTADLLKEAGQNSIANQLSTVNQHLIYQAILHLGIPELALDKSPYRSAILRGIKDTALELAHTPAMRNTLKIFIKQQAADDAKAPEDEKHRGEGKHHKADTYDDGMKAAGVVKPAEKKKQQPPITKKAPPKAPAEEPVQEALEDSIVGSYWASVRSIMDLLDPTTEKEYATRVTDNMRYKSLVAKSRSAVPKKLTAGARTKLKNLATVLSALSLDAADEVTEAFSHVDASNLLKRMLELGDAELAAQVVGSQVYKRLIAAGRQGFARANTAVKRALEQLEMELGKITEAELSFSAPSSEDEVEDVPAEEPKADEQPKAASDAEAPETPQPAKDASESGVSFKAAGDAVKIAYPGGSFEVSGESLERAMKAMTNKQTLSVKLDNGKFAVFSPRGSSGLIKMSGSEAKISLTPPDISAFLDACQQVIDGVEDEEKETAKPDEAKPVA